jgi:hypothetical protein
MDHGYRRFLPGDEVRLNLEIIISNCAHARARSGRGVPPCGA